MYWYSFLLPAAAAAVIILVLLSCPRLKTAELEMPGADERKFSKKDTAAILIITALYAAVAFYALGNTSSPQSFCHFTKQSDYAEVQLEGETYVSKMRFFAGLNTGKYYIQFSDDGVDYRDVGIMDQSYSNIFKWCDADFQDGADLNTKYIRIVSGSDLYMGELGIYDESDTLVSTDRMSFTDGETPLFDEQPLVPEQMTYMNSSYFDEVYHARTALENMEGIYPYEVSHPPLGKIILSLGMRMFGVTPFGWRFMGTLFGVMMLPALYVFLKKLFGSVSVPACGTVLFAFDFMHYVQTRIATIDTYAVFFIILMYLFMYLYCTSDRWKYLALSGLFFGIGAATKWTCLYAGAGLGVIWLCHWILKGKDFKFGAFVKNCLFCLVFFVLIPGIIYYASYYPYGQAKGLEGLGMYFTKEYADIVIENQKFMMSYHLGVKAAHPYSSRWYQWVLDIRPILYYLSYTPDGKSVSSFGAWVNPMVCWGGLLAVFAMIYLTLFRRDRRAGFILIGYLAQLVPWMFIKRTTFEYHYFACTVFLVLALAYIFDLIRRGRIRWKAPVYGFTAMSTALFIAFYPALSGLTVTLKYADGVLGWLPTWPF
jgi:dolichyl-phosphate-mannose-protein mannosyltransferase